ncbi:DUF2290 domain-containing protein [Methylobacillus methanolivorans]|uniref:DUF2290 domain-containing protein n=1 Tax=Methylobacillus methanolivorans TaxID=1848927 RepID=A0ABW8GIB4_9PROT
MTDREFKQSIAKAYNFFRQMGIEKSFIHGYSLPVSQPFNSIALDTNSPYPDVFYQGLKLSHFNFNLQDYSYFQFSFNGPEDLRYAFYPSPFGPGDHAEIKDLTIGFEEGLIDQEEFEFALQGLKNNYARPLLRYEYNSNQYKSGCHPASHLHLGTFGEDRWTIHKKLTPYVFALIIAKHYFGEHWEAITEFDVAGIRLSNEFDMNLFREKTECSITPVHMFTDHETRGFYFL